MSSFWLYIASGMAFCLLIALLVLIKRKKSNKKQKNAPTIVPVAQSVSPDSAIQSIIQNLPKSNGQSHTLLLAAPRLTELPVTIPIHLAIHLAGRGKCLVIDLDMKRDALARVFDIDSSRIDLNLRTSPVQTSFENLAIWPARYFDLLKQTNLGALLRTASRKYDHILLYAPYLTVLADRKQIAFTSKQAIVFCKQSEQQAQEHLRRLLKVCNCKILHEI